MNPLSMLIHVDFVIPCCFVSLDTFFEFETAAIDTKFTAKWMSLAEIQKKNIRLVPPSLDSLLIDS